MGKSKKFGLAALVAVGLFTIVSCPGNVKTSVIDTKNDWEKAFDKILIDSSNQSNPSAFLVAKDDVDTEEISSEEGFLAENKITAKVSFTLNGNNASAESVTSALLEAYEKSIPEGVEAPDEDTIRTQLGYFTGALSNMSAEDVVWNMATPNWTVQYTKGEKAEKDDYGFVPGVDVEYRGADGKNYWAMKNYYGADDELVSGWTGWSDSGSDSEPMLYESWRFLVNALRDGYDKAKIDSDQIAYDVTLYAKNPDDSGEGGDDNPADDGPIQLTTVEPSAEDAGRYEKFNIKVKFDDAKNVSEISMKEEMEISYNKMMAGGNGAEEGDGPENADASAIPDIGIKYSIDLSMKFTYRDSYEYEVPVLLPGMKGASN